MKGERLARIIGLIDDDLIAESETPHRKRNLRPLFAACACVCLIALGAFGISNIRMGRSGGTETVGGETSDTADYSGGTADGEMIYYADPTLPITLLQENANLAAERSVSYSITESGMTITDSYVITNSSAEDARITALYPYVGSLVSNTPTITVDGVQTEPAYYAGSHIGGFMDGDGEFDSLNFDNSATWVEIAETLEDGSYLESAVADVPELNETVYVYHVTNGEAPSDCSAATVCMSFEVGENTQVFSYKMNGFGSDGKTEEYSYFAREWDKNEAYVIVMGEDISDYSLQGYKNGALEEKVDFEYTAQREEMTLGEFLHFAAEQEAESLRQSQGADVPAADTDVLYAALVELWQTYGTFGAFPADRYSVARLDDVLMDAWAIDRVIYSGFDATVPADGSITVTASMTVPIYIGGSYWEGYNVENAQVVLLTYAGSNIDFSSISASVELVGGVQIVSDSFGFDADNGISSVTLAMPEDEYYIEVTGNK